MCNTIHIHVCMRLLPRLLLLSYRRRGFHFCVWYSLYAFHIADTCSIWRQYIRGEIWHMMKFIPGNASQIGPSAPVFLLYYFQDYFYLCFIWFHEVCVGKEIQCRGCPISRAATSFWTSEIPLPNLFWQVKKKERKKRERVWLEVKGTLAL